MSCIQFVAPIGRLKATAKKLERMIRRNGFEIRHYPCLDLAARLYGFFSYQDYLRTKPSKDLVRWDHEISQEDFDSRHEYQMNILVEAGYGEFAENLLEEVDPTEASAFRGGETETHRGFSE